MVQSSSVQWLRDSLSFPFQGECWQHRFAVGCALELASIILCFAFSILIVPWFIPTLFITGYTLCVLRQAVHGEKLSLPPWENWVQLLIDGLRWMLITLIYLGPGLLLIACGSAAYLAVMLKPFSSVSIGAQWSLECTILVAMACLFSGLFLGGCLLAFGTVLFGFASTHFAATNNVGAALRVREWWPIVRANPWGFLLAWIGTLGLLCPYYLGIMLVCCSWVLCALLPFIVAPGGVYLGLVIAALFGQAYREGVVALAGRAGQAVSVISSPIG